MAPSHTRGRPAGGEIAATGGQRRVPANSSRVLDCSPIVNAKFTVSTVLHRLFYWLKPEDVRPVNGNELNPLRPMQTLASYVLDEMHVRMDDDLRYPRDSWSGYDGRSSGDGFDVLQNNHDPVWRLVSCLRIDTGRPWPGLSRSASSLPSIPPTMAKPSGL